MPEILYAVVPEPRLSRPVARLQALAHRMRSALLLVVAAVVAVSIVIFIRVVPTRAPGPALARGLGAVTTVSIEG